MAAVGGAGGGECSEGVGEREKGEEVATKNGDEKR